MTSDSSPPTTEVLTFLIADIRGYTAFTQEHGDEAAARLADRFRAIVDAVAQDHAGRRLELRGDEALVVFRSARQALRAAVAMQSRFAQEDTTGSTMRLEVGIGLDAGEAVPLDGGYRGEALNLASRLCGIAAAGEVLASEGVIHLARKVDGLIYEDRGPADLKGFAEAVTVIAVRSTEGDEQRAVPPTRAPVAAPVGGFLGAIPEGPIVGRERELAHLRQLAIAVEQGNGALVVLRGEPGVGKTRLAQELSVDVGRRGFLLVTGTCYESRQGAPYHPFVEALDMLVSASPPGIAAEIPRRWRYLARLLPDRGIPAPPPGANDPEEQERLFRTVADLLQACAVARPVALMLDDLHWADHSSLDLLQFIVRQCRAAPVLILGTYRDVEVERVHPLSRMLLELHRQQLLDTVSVGPLDQRATTELVRVSLGDSDVPPDFGAQLYRRTDGNPFFVQEMLRSLLERRAADPAAGSRFSGWDASAMEHLSVPERVRGVIAQRLDRLSEPARELLYDASVLGQTFDFDDVQALSDRSEDEIERGLVEAGDAGLVRNAGRDRFVFYHALTQQALYTELRPRQRRRLHAKVVQRLAALPERVREERAAEIAWHALEADESEMALEYAVLAGDRAASLAAHAEAERLYRMALDVAWQTGSDREHGELSRLEAGILEKVAGVLRIQGKNDDAVEALERAAQLYGELNDAESERRAVAQVGLIDAVRGRVPEGRTRLQPLLEAAEAEAASEGLVLLLIARSQLALKECIFPEALDAAERARALAGELQRRDLQVEADIRRGEALVGVGRVKQARRVLEEVVRTADQQDLAPLSRAFAGMGLTCLASGDFLQSRQYFARSAELAEQSNDTRRAIIAGQYRAVVLFLLGDWKAARRQIEQATGTARSAGLQDLVPFQQAILGQILLYQGDADAPQLLHDALEAANAEADSNLQAFARTTLAEGDLMRDDAAAACAALEPLLGLTGIDQSIAVAMELTLAHAYLLGGDADAVRRAEELVLRAIQQAMTLNSRAEMVHGLWVQGIVRVAQKRYEEAERLFQGTLDVVRKMPYPWREATVLGSLADLAEQREDRGEARRWWEQALAIYRKLGARPAIAATEARLSAAGAFPSVSS